MNVYPLKCRIRAEAGVTRVDVYDDIGGGGWFSDGVSAADFAGQLAGLKGALEIHINSGGGDVFDGISIGNSIRGYKGPVTTVVDGLAASIASVIAQAGHERVAEPGSMYMIHDAFGMCVGNAAEMAEMAATLDKVSDNIAGIYAGRAGGSAESWRDQMRGEKWYTAEEAVAAGLADRVGDGAAELPAGLDLAAFTAVPGRIAARLGRMPVAAAPPHGPMTGTHSHPHPANGSQGSDGAHDHEHSHDGDANHGHAHGGAQDRAAGRPAAADMHGDHVRVDPDGDGDCDACPEGDTDHDYWSEDGEQLQPLPDDTDDVGNTWHEQVRAIVREMIRDAADGVDSSPWDASKAWHNGAESDDPAAFYAGICAGKKDGDKATQAAWALPYKYHPGDAPNAAGVKNALSRLPQTQGLTNEAEAKSLLQGLMKKINPDYEPEDRAHLSGMTPEQFRAALRGATA